MIRLVLTIVAGIILGGIVHLVSVLRCRGSPATMPIRG